MKFRQLPALAFFILWLPIHIHVVRDLAYQPLAACALILTILISLLVGYAVVETLALDGGAVPEVCRYKRSMLTRKSRHLGDGVEAAKIAAFHALPSFRRQIFEILH